MLENPLEITDQWALRAIPTDRNGQHVAAGGKAVGRLCHLKERSYGLIGGDLSNDTTGKFAEALQANVQAD